MEKTLSERIAARAAETKSLSSHGNQNRAVFLSLRADIQQALSDGWSVKSIWETLHAEGKVTFCYSAFCDYTNQLIGTPTNQPATRSINEPGDVGKNTNTVNTETKTKETSQIGGFTFNPSPRKEDLI